MLLEQSILHRDLDNDRITLDSNLYIQFLKKLLKRAFILASDSTTKSLLGSLPVHTHHIKRQYSSSWIIYQEPYQSSNWNASLNIHFLVGTNSVLMCDLRVNPTSSRGLNLLLFPITYKEIKNNTLIEDLMTIYLEKAMDNLEFYARQQATTPQEAHQDEKKAYKILNMAITHQALLKAIKHCSINAIGSIGFSTQFYADDESKEALQILTKQIKHRKDLLLNSLSKEDRIEINKKLSIHEHLQSSGYTMNYYKQSALSVYLKDQLWMDNKNARIARSRNINEYYMQRERLTYEIIRVEYTIWGEKNIVSFKRKKLHKITKWLKRYLPKLKPFAEAFKQMKTFKNKELDLILEQTLKATISQILFDSKLERPIKHEANPLSYLYPPPVP